MLVLRLLVMVLTIICLMDGHAEVSSSTTGIRDRRESPAVKTNDSEVDVRDRKKKKKPKPSKKKKPKPGKKKPKPNKAKPKPTKPVTTTTTMSTSTLKTTTILTTPTITTTATTTTTTVSPTTTETTVKTITSTASVTTTLSTTTSATTSATTTTVATSSTGTTTITTIPTTATTSSLQTTAATTADSGAGGECKATNGNPCIFPFKDGNEEYNECKNEGGKYFWCATSVYDSGKYKHWSYCSTDGPCPLEGDGECRAANNKPCVFPFKDGEKEYNECADHGGQYFWCATGTNSAGKYTAWSKCPKDGSCPLPQKTTTPLMTPTTTVATTTLLTTGTSMAPDEIENKVVSSLKDLVKEESKDGTLEMLEEMHKITEAIIDDLKAQSEDNDPKHIESNHTYEGGNPRSHELSLHYQQGVKSGKTREIKQNFEFVQNTVSWCGSISPVSDASGCCSECQMICSDAAFFDYSHYFGKCYCYKKLSTTEAMIRENNRYSAGDCGQTQEAIWNPGYISEIYIRKKGDNNVLVCNANFMFKFDKIETKLVIGDTSSTCTDERDVLNLPESWDNFPDDPPAINEEILQEVLNYQVDTAMESQGIIDYQFNSEDGYIWECKLLVSLLEVEGLKGPLKLVVDESKCSYCIQCSEGGINTRVRIRKSMLAMTMRARKGRTRMNQGYNIAYKMAQFASVTWRVADKLSQPEARCPMGQGGFDDLNYSWTSGRGNCVARASKQIDDSEDYTPPTGESLLPKGDELVGLGRLYQWGHLIAADIFVKLIRGNKDYLWKASALRGNLFAQLAEVNQSQMKKSEMELISQALEWEQEYRQYDGTRMVVSAANFLGKTIKRVGKSNKMALPKYTMLELVCYNENTGKVYKSMTWVIANNKRYNRKKIPGSHLNSQMNIEIGNKNNQLNKNPFTTLQGAVIGLKEAFTLRLPEDGLGEEDKC